MSTPLFGESGEWTTQSTHVRTNDISFSEKQTNKIDVPRHPLSAILLLPSVSFPMNERAYS